MTINDIAHSDETVAAYTNVLCRECHMIMTKVEIDIRKCPQCGIAAEVQCSLSVIDDD